MSHNLFLRIRFIWHCGMQFPLSYYSREKQRIKGDGSTIKKQYIQTSISIRVRTCIQNPRTSAMPGGPYHPYKICMLSFFCLIRHHGQ
ncbi:hypothetical protein D4759_06935 [Clostridiales bacterium AHG0011]|nr:hypothetical protein [Clostridiales bacterium AHG0011]